jgi:UDP:flavonoid glycosyltransferase YjiC (YdhE family)
MAVVLIWMSPEMGHLVPTIKIAQDLTALGHRALHLVPAGVAADVAGFGCEPWPIHAGLNAAVDAYTLSGGSVSCYYDPLRAEATDHAAYVDAIRGELARAVESTAAELLLVDGIYEDLWELGSAEGLGGRCAVARLYTHLPYKPASRRSLSPHNGPQIFLSPPEFELPSWRRAEAFYTDPSIADGGSAIAFPWEQVDAARPLVYCSFGSQMTEYPGMPEMFRTILDLSTRSQQFQFVLSAGPLARELRASQRSDAIVVERAPQVSILRRCAAVIAHGGFGTIKECAYLGVPSVLVPQRLDQPFNSARVAHHRTGLAIRPAAATAAALGRALEEVVSAAPYRDGVGRMQATFAERQRGRRTAELCDTLLESTTGGRRAAAVGR